MVLTLTTPQLLFIIFVPIVVLVVVFLFAFLPLRRLYRKKYYLNVDYKTVRGIAVNKDYYLINNYRFKITDTKKALINHVLFAEKYIYLIICNYYEGDLMGQEQDKYLVLVPKKGKKKYVSNLYIDIKKLRDRLALDSDQDPDLFIGIILTNDDINIGVETNNKHFYMIQRNKLAQLIKAIESRDIAPLNEVELEKAVKAFAKNKL